MSISKTAISSNTAAVWRLTAIAFTGGLGGGVVFPILPTVGLKLGIPAAVIGLILSLNRMTRLLVNPFTGTLVDRFGPRWPLTAGMLTEALATLSFSAGMHSAHPAIWFLVGRGLWGVGSSLMMVGALTGALALSHGGNRGMSTAKVRMALSFGVPAGLLLGGVVADLVSANAAFLSASAITLAGMIGAAIFVPGKAPYPTPASTSETNTTDAEPSVTLRHLLRPSPLWVVWTFNFLVFFSVQGVILAGLVLVIQQKGLTLLHMGAEGSAGLFMAVMIGTSAVVSLILGRRIDRSSNRTGLLVPATLLLAGGFTLLAATSHSLSTGLALAIIGTGLGGINLPLMVILGDLVDRRAYGRAIGIYQFFGDVGGSLGPITGLEGIQRYGAGPVLLCLALLTAVMVPLAVVLWRREHRAART